MQHARHREVVAILVLFDPHSDPRAVVQGLAQALGGVVVVDNALQGHPHRDVLAAQPGVQLLRNANRGGLAGAYNAALRHLEASALPWSAIVFVDDDSDTSVLGAFLSDPVTRAALGRPDTAAVSAVYRDRATGLRAAYTQLERFRYRSLPREQRGLVPVAFLINSMSVWRREALQRLGAFNEALSVDRIDTDYCLRARRAGLGVFINGDHVFAHSIGRRVSYTFFGVTLQTAGYGPERRFMIARNTVWLARRYLRADPALLWLSFLWIGYEVVGVLMAERNKPAKLTAIARGVWRGLVSSMPKQTDASGRKCAGSSAAEMDDDAP